MPRLPSLPLMLAALSPLAAHAADKPAPPVSITVTDKGCVPSSLSVPAGKSLFRIENESHRALEWEILRGVSVVAERENILPGFTQPLSVTLAAGEYSMTCGLLSNPRGVLKVSGTTQAALATPAELVEPIAQYKAYVVAETDALVTATAAFTAAIKAGDLAAAQRLYAPARAHYERIEPIAELFDDLDKAMDARVDDFEKKEADPTWTGFHRLEHALWVKKSTAGLPATADKLAADTDFANDALDAEYCHGDLLLQFNANTAETNIHALRDILKSMPEYLALRWKIDGFLPPHTIKKQGRDTVRNLLGFKDGTANLDPRDTPLMDRQVWTDEPGWTAGGSYQVMRLIRMLVERWDRTPLGEQQTIFGRSKAEGAPLGMAREHDIPDYAADPDGKGVPLDAHIRLANPRSAETQTSLILRRGYNYSRGLTKAGQLDMGLIFGCFQSDLAAGFLAVQSRLNGEASEEYIKPFGGGYYFALPGVRAQGDSFGSALMAG